MFLMSLDKWITINFTMLQDTTLRVVKNNQEADDVLQSVIEQLLHKREQLDEIPDKNKLYYFIRVLKNNYYSTTSNYYREHKKGSVYNKEWDECYEAIPDEVYKEEIPDIEWVKKELDTLPWFDRDLFLLWFELGTIINVSSQTTIPKNSVSRYIKQTKKLLQKRWESKN